MATAEAQRPFDLSTGPVFRSVLYRLPASGLLLLTMPHIVSDGWSVGITRCTSSSVLLDAFVRGAPSPLPRAAGAVRRLRGVAARHVDER